MSPLEPKIRQAILEGTAMNGAYASTQARFGDLVRTFAENVLVSGERVNSRYGPCIEKLGGRLEVPSGILIARKGMNLSLGWMEMVQVIAGVFELEALKVVAPKADHSLFTYRMSYGPRIVGSIRSIIEALREDPNTRQAVLFVASPLDGPTSDLPCTLTIQFLVRRERLNAIVSMRSWDLCRGLPYDLMMFSGLLESIGRCLGIATGNIIVQAGSTHVYEDWVNLLPETDSRYWSFTDEVPRNWYDLTVWAASNVSLLKKGGIPQGIEIISM